jgi:alkylhydroperoxidase family enzyme
MPRIPEIDPDATTGYVAAVLNAQRRHWGAPLNPYLVYGRRPVLLKAVQGMWAGVDSEGLIGSALLSLINRRVASLNGCVF